MTSRRDALVAVVGAGAAGIAAAAGLRAAGIGCITLEASARVGGRAHTSHPAQLGGALFDHGAVWLHAAQRNPVVTIARAAGAALIDSDAARQEHLWHYHAWATAEERRAYHAAWDAWEGRAAELAARHGPDRNLADVADALAADAALAPWIATIEAWEGPVIDAEQPGRVSVRDWRDNALDGGNLIPAEGLGAFVARELAPRAGDIRLHTPVQAIVLSGAGVQLTMPAGTLQADAAIVTASTAVLHAGAIRFDPDLPPATRDAIASLPLGLAMKVALRAAGDDRLGLPAFSLVERVLRHRGEVLTLFDAWPAGRDHVIAWIGGDAARAFAAIPDPAAAARAAEDHARTELRRVFGARADAAFTPGAVVTRWDSDPWVRGAYSNARPGHAGARAVLAAPLADGRLIFAGEACHAGLAGTVGGAWASGRDAARAAATALGADASAIID